VDVSKMVVGSSVYWYDIFIHVNKLVKITPNFLIDPLGLFEHAPICNAGVFRDLIEMPNIDFESSIAQYQQ